MKHTLPSLLLAGALSSVPQSTEAKIEYQLWARVVSIVNEKALPNDKEEQERCEAQSVLLARELAPYIRLRLMTSFSHLLEGVELRLTPAPSWIREYVITRVEYYLHHQSPGLLPDEQIVENLGIKDIPLVLPYKSFSLRLNRGGKSRLDAEFR